MDDFSDIDPWMLDRNELLAARFWVTAAAQPIHVSKMTDSHVLNAHRHVIERTALWEAEARAAASFMPASNDSMAAYYADRAVDEASDAVLLGHAWVKVFEEEIAKRGLQPR